MQVGKSKLFIASSQSANVTIHRLLREVPGYEIVAQAHERHEAVRQVKSTQPVLVVFEHGSPGLDTVETIKDMRREAPGVRFLILLTDESQFWTVLASKAEGYLIWPTAWLPNAITAIANGGEWLGPLLTQYLLNGDGWNILRSASTSLSALPPIFNVLSPREKEVLNFLADGLTNQEIADSLELSSGTVKVHVKHILSKLNVTNRAQAVAMLSKIRTGNGH